jgi:outer membrane translocation and assembly module TamA
MRFRRWAGAGARRTGVDEGNGSDTPTVAVTMRLTEGPQYFVNRLTFTGNTTTRDHVIRREVRLVEGGVFSTEALKYSVRRLNQLGYFKPLEGNEKDLQVEKTPAREHAVDVHSSCRSRITRSVWRRLSQCVACSQPGVRRRFMGRGET